MAEPTARELLERIEALEQQASADQLQPGVFNLNAAGELEEILSGVLSAKGIKFQAAEGSFLSNCIQWLNKAGKLIMRVCGSQGGIGKGRFNRLTLETLNEEGGEAAGVRIQSQPELSAVEVFAGLALLTLLNQAGESRLLQLARLAKVTINVRTITLEWAGGTQFSNGVKLAGLAGGANAFMLITGGPGHIVAMSYAFGGVENKEAEVAGFCVTEAPAAGTKLNCTCVAIFSSSPEV